MRVLFTCIGGSGHLNPLLPISRAVTDAGHTVLWATSDSLRVLVENAGFSYCRLGSAAGPAAPRKREPLLMVDVQRSEEEVRENFANCHTCGH